MRHVDYREWADEVLGDRRQVYARDIRKEPDAPLTYMRPGEAKRFHADARADHLICPVPGCPSPELTTRGPTERRHHFVHRQAPGDAGHGREYARRVTVRVLREWLEGQSQALEINEDADVSGVPVTLLVTSPRTGRQVALIYVDQRYGVDAWGADYRQLKAADVPASWIFALRPMFFRLPQPSPAAGAEDPVARDHARGDLVLDRAIYREMRSASLWPLLISLERQELANLVTPTGRIARPLGLQPPESGDRVLHLVPTPIADAHLTRYGIATQAVPEKFLQHAWQEPPPLPPTPRREQPSVHDDRGDRPTRTEVPADGALSDLWPPPVHRATAVPDERARRWARARTTLQRQLADPALADELAEPLPTDVECDLLAVHWHTVLAVWLTTRRRLGRDPWQLRRKLSDAGAGPKLTTAAVEGFLDWWQKRSGR